MKRDAILSRVLKNAILAVLWVYREGISPFTPRCCRFTPTCSAYACTAVKRFGAIKGTWLTLWRVARCHPFYGGCLYDPVPPLAPPASRDYRSPIPESE